MMNSCRKIKIEPPDFGEAVYINEKTVEVQTDHSHPINCQVWCPSCCTSDVAIPEYPDMEVPIMKTVATQTDHTHSEGWIVQCTICSSSAVPNAPVQDAWRIKLETPYHSELPQCQSSTGTLTNGIDSRVQDMCVETNHPYAESVQRSFDAAVYRMERSDTEMRRRNMGLGPGEHLRRQFSPDHGMARSVEVSETAEMSCNFLIPGNVVTTHMENMSRGIPVTRMDDMSCGFSTPRNGDILHVNEASSNFGGAGDADSPRRVVLPPNVVEVNALGYEVERRSPENKTIPVSGTYNHVMENGDLLENHQDVSYDNPLDSLQNGVEEEKDKAIRKVRRGPRKGAKKTKSMKASKGTNASEAQKRNWKNVYQCPYCDMSFGWLSHITRHVRSHTGEKPFKCSHCTKRFARTDELQLHLRVHTGERPYECQYCGKKFTQSANLTVHIRIHTGKKPYKCDICKKRFVHSGDYRRHLRVHTREKPYECCYCFKAFADSSDLKVHIRIHTGEMPYQCPLCFKRFRTSGNLNVHVRGGSCQKTKEALKGKKITQLKKTSADLPIMTSAPVPMMAEMPNAVQPAEGLSNLQETQ